MKLGLSFISSFMSKRRTLLCCIVFFLLVTLLFVNSSGKMINPDGVEYIAVAHHYALHHFMDAINGITSPLVSWILSLSFNLSVAPFLFFRFMLIAVSLITIINFDMFLRGELKTESIDYKKYIYKAGLVFITIFCIYATLFTPLTPDLFSVLFLIWLLLALRRYDNKHSYLNAILVGIAAGLGYYGKNYFVYFAVVATILYFVAKYLVERKGLKLFAKHFATILVVVLAFVGPWVGVMSVKYGHFTVDPIGPYVLGTEAPNWPGTFYKINGLQKPLYQDSFDAREDPSLYKSYVWSPLSSARDLKYYATTVVYHNITIAYKIMLPATAIVGIAIYLVLSETKQKRFLKDNYRALWLVATGLIYVGGYCVTNMAGGFRYIWPAYILFALAFILLSQRIRTQVRVYVLVIGTLILSLYPVYTYYPKAQVLARQGSEQQKLSYKIEQQARIPKNARIASNNYIKAVYVCYRLDLKCYGYPLPGHVEEQLKKYKINYVLNFHNKPKLNIKNGVVVFSNKDISVIKLAN